MLQTLQQKWKKILTLALAFVLSSYLFLPLQPAAEANVLTELIRRVRVVFAPPGGTAPTGRRQGGGGRGPLCPAFLEASIKALVPAQNGSDDSTQSISTELVWGKTTEEYPTLWFYIPYEADILKSAKLVVLDESKQLLPKYPLMINLAETPGIISIRLPHPLALNKQYGWYFSVICSIDKPSRNPSIRGWIQRVDAIATKEYQSYAENGIWYDLVTDLIDRYQRDPNRYREDWLGLLEYLGAEDLKDAAIASTTNSQSTHTLPNNGDAHTEGR
jgi:Domain of Unknown Function (DUF928)